MFVRLITRFINLASGLPTSLISNCFRKFYFIPSETPPYNNFSIYLQILLTSPINPVEVPVKGTSPAYFVLKQTVCIHWTYIVCLSLNSSIMDDKKKRKSTSQTPTQQGTNCRTQHVAQGTASDQDHMQWNTYLCITTENKPTCSSVPQIMIPSLH